MRTLEKLIIQNFKSIREQTLALGRLNVFIGGNGAGKSNLIDVFKFLRELMSGRLGEYTAKKGGADALLHFGRKKSPEMCLKLTFGEGSTVNGYAVNLMGTLDDTLVITNEMAYEREQDQTGDYWQVSSTSRESKLKQDNHICAHQVISDMENCRVYHFHDTSDTAAVKGTCDVEDNRFLRPQADNLAAFLYWMQKKQPDHFQNISDTIRQIAPFFDEFRLEPSKLNESKIRLEWRERSSDAYFNASSLSDGTLRFCCLATLLLQPDLPAVILLDEPEIGLHPAAVNLLAGLLESASTRTQVIVATQSVTLVNQLTPESVWTVDREDGQSVFRHLSDSDMSGWLEGYSLGELWEKNILGARP
jgi:predicted ATPase